MKHFRKLACLFALLCLTTQASAAGPMEYNISGTGNPEYGKPTSIEVTYTADGGAMKNEDVSKNAALAPPGFGTPSADTRNTGTPLTPNLAPGYQPSAGAVVNGSITTVTPPDILTTTYIPGSSTVTVDIPSSSSSEFSGNTEVTSDLYYSGGHLGTLEIPTLGVKVKVYEGTDSKTLAKGAGHFPDTNIWNGNVGIAGHNRGAACYFGDIHTLSLGDKIKFTTKLGTRTYAVTSVAKVDETDHSGLEDSDTNMITLYTCVRDQKAYRWCVQAEEIV